MMCSKWAQKTRLQQNLPLWHYSEKKNVCERSCVRPWLTYIILTKKKKPSIETCTISYKKRMASPGLMQDTGSSGLVHCGMTQRDGTGRERGVGFRMGNMCTPVADSCWCMAKTIQYCKVISLQLKISKFILKKKKPRKRMRQRNWTCALSYKGLADQRELKKGGWERNRESQM